MSYSLTFLLLQIHVRLNDELKDNVGDFSKLGATTNYDCIHWSCHYCSGRSVTPLQRKTMAQWIVDFGGPADTDKTM